MQDRSSINGLDMQGLKKGQEFASLTDKLINHELAPKPGDSIMHKLQET
jgi:hypothetical protein